MKGFIREFKTFLNRGNVLDLAVGVIIGGAFKSITDSLTNDILMPLLGLLVDRVSFSDLTLTIGSATIAYGSFVEAVLNFIIMAFAVFCIVKAFNRLHRKKEEAAPPPKPSNEELLLTEIRDLLKEGK
ncbi:large-conductance mechanosensitive channel protein MscL [Pseudoflavonifractor capillosus]|uniref:large-conductance mechanosensitive channel protein MscL n=1 Tax=Pseudoflavonifractor capillosus TaxID=106588 RepID=UPI00195EB49C|nr:large-conductance mechanosensitive channel protein MscL [Pseudoflavonifractor capillosus]MBM6896930.1 large-conductance mechanosensitive channel protein MscL [Pseudoflavonifractor capillosus]